MVFRLTLDAELSVERDGLDCGLAPNSSVAVLLVGLARHGRKPLSRDTAASLLFPNSDLPSALNAFRQTLLRLRRWLGEGCIETEGRELWLGSTWRSEPDVFNGGKVAKPFMVAIEHPWLATIRKEWTKEPDSTLDPALEGFVTAIRQALQEDPTAARAMLVNGEMFTDRLSRQEFEALLAATHPRSRRDPFAVHHLLCEVDFLHHQSRYEEAHRLAMRGVQLAARTGDFGLLNSFRYQLSYNSVELGRFSEALWWLAEVDERHRARFALQEGHCKAVILWNKNQLAEAMAEMRVTRHCVNSGDRRAQIHYWSNYSVLAAEAGQVELSEDLSARASEVLNRGRDHVRSDMLDLAESNRLIFGGEAEAAITLLSEARMRAELSQRRASVLYMDEALGEAYALSGRAQAARQSCKQVDQVRVGRFNPRVAARRERIEALIP